MGLPVAAGAEGLVVPIARRDDAPGDGSVGFDPDLGFGEASRTGLAGRSSSAAR